MPSFLVVSPDLEATGPVVDVNVAVSGKLASFLRTAGKVVPFAVRVRALIDTGATKSALAPYVIEQLGIEPFDMATVRSANRDDARECGMFKVDLTITDGPTNSLCLANLTVLAVLLKGQPVQALLGRDVLKTAHFRYDGDANQYALRFPDA